MPVLTIGEQVIKGIVPHITAVTEAAQTTAHLGDSSKKISFWHDIPYRSTAGRDSFLFVCEIPAKCVVFLSSSSLLSQPHAGARRRWK